MTASLFWYDFETTGINPRCDRPLQVAGIRTDENLNEIGEPLNLYCRLSPDILPHPQACLVTGIGPQVIAERGLPEAEFIARLHAEMAVPGTCTAGYNSLRFDDEVSRNIFYRNFYDPYAWSWQHDNSRWDLLDVMRACYALRPEGINWPENDDGLPSFRLEHLTVANDIEHSNAHDAMADVYATIAMAKLVKTQQPKLIDYLYAYRGKNKLMTLIDVPQMKPLVHVSGMFGAWRGNTSWVAPLAWHPDNRNAVIMVDLAGDIAPLPPLTHHQGQIEHADAKQKQSQQTPEPEHGGVYLQQSQQAQECRQTPGQQRQIDDGPTAHIRSNPQRIVA